MCKGIEEALPVPVLLHGSRTILKKEKYTIRAVKLYNLRGLLGIRKMYKVPNAWIKDLCCMMIGKE